MKTDARYQPQKLRDLSEIESFYVKFNVSIVVVSHFTGTLLLERLQEVLSAELQRHPLLSSCIREEKGTYSFWEAPASDFTLTTVKIHDSSLIRDFILEALNKKLAINNRLYDFTYIIESNRFTLISTIHHAVGDGMCCMEFHKNIIQGYRQLSHPKEILPLMEPVEAYIPKSITSEQLEQFVKAYHEKTVGLDAKIIEPQANTENNLPTVNFVQRILKPLHTQKLIQLSKAHSVSMHGLISAAHLLALKKMMDKSVSSLTICFHSPIDIRSRLEPPLSNEHMFSAAIGCTSCYTLTADTTLLDLAKDVEQKIKNYINTNDIFKGLLTFSKTRLTFKIPSALGITNLGLVSIPAEDDALNLDNIYFIPSYTLPMLGVSVGTFNHQLTLTYPFAEPFFTELQLNQLADYVVAEFEKKYED